MSRTLAAEFLLLALNDESGKPLIDSTKLKAAVAGATIVELTVAGALRLTGPGDPDHKRDRLIRTGHAEPSDPQLREVLGLADGRKPKDAVSKIGGASDWRGRAGSIKDGILLGLAEEGVLRQEKAKILGLFPTTAWKPEQPSVEAEIVQRVRQAVVLGTQPDQRTAALISLVHAVDLLPKLFPGADKKAVRARGKEISEGDWGGVAVKKAIEEVNAAMTAIIASTAVAGAAGSS